MRLISFAWTVEPFKAGRKSMTHRLWKKLPRPGEKMLAVDHSPRGGKGYTPLGIIQVVTAEWADLFNITPVEVELEGGLWKTPDEFIEAFIKGHGGMKTYYQLTKIAFTVLWFRGLPEYSINTPVVAYLYDGRLGPLYHPYWQFIPPEDRDGDSPQIVGYLGGLPLTEEKASRIWWRKEDLTPGELAYGISKNKKTKGRKKR